MRVRCVCGDWHEVSPTGLALIVGAYQDGDMQRIGKEGVTSLCIAEAFTDWRREEFNRRYNGNVITITSYRDRTRTGEYNSA